jgi:hypothetical protein
MKKKDKMAALRLLYKVLETQPTLLTSKLGNHSGQSVADFCIGFIERYSEWRNQKDQSAD